MDAKEKRRLKKLLAFETAARNKGFGLIAGIDEVGRGCLAGPVVAAACCIPQGIFIEGVDDSKKLSPQKRREVYDRLISAGVTYGIGIIDHEVIDKVNIFQATILAMQQAFSKLDPAPDYLLVDGLALSGLQIPCEKLIGGDARSYSIAAASIIAKVTRDAMMCKFHEEHPHWGFDEHKGYGTPAHLKAIIKHGASPIHRLSFAPLKGSS